MSLKDLSCRSAQAWRLKSLSIVRLSRGACSSAPASVFTFLIRYYLSIKLNYYFPLEQKDQYAQAIFLF
jgi:hypothetical protein